MACEIHRSSPLEQQRFPDPMNVSLRTALRSQSFTIALLAVVFAAILFPELGARDGPLKTDLTSRLAVALTFLVQGLSLRTRQLARSAVNLRFHGFCQASNFLLAPLLMVGLLYALGDLVHRDLRAGFLFLAVLPTTISSAVVMTGNSGGDASAALFSTTLSNLLGIVLTPLWCVHLIAGASGQGLSLSDLTGELATLLLLPLMIGQMLRLTGRDLFNRARPLLRWLSNAFILFIAFAALCNSVESGVWRDLGWSSGLGAGTVVLLFLALLSIGVWFSAPVASPAFPQRIAAFFCGSQKTLAAGVPMASIIFSNGVAHQSAGLVILPLMLYHPVQLVLAGAISPVFARHASGKAT